MSAAYGLESRRGQPVLFLGLLLAGWLLLRVVSWENPWTSLVLPDAPQASMARGADRMAPPQTEASPLTKPETASLPVYAGPVPFLRPSSSWDIPARAEEDILAQQAQQSFAADRTALGHSLLWMSGMAQLPMPQSVAQWLDRPTADRADRPAQTARSWRVDAWLLLRDGGVTPSRGGALVPTYGASQAGAVIAYRLDARSRHEPAAYMRASKALSGPASEEVAAGLRVRPLASLPVTLHGEVRADRTGETTRLRPAIFVTTGLERAQLPAGLEASGYGQAGYVAGDFATGFVDGKVDVTRPHTLSDRSSFAAGGGVWGGAQRGAARLDIGPTLKLDLGIGSGSARVAADYRIRIAGDAEPASGAAITLSAGF